MAPCLEGVATNIGKGFLGFLWITGMIRLLSHWTKLEFHPFYSFSMTKDKPSSVFQQLRRSLSVPETSNMPPSSPRAGSIHASLLPHLFMILRSKHKYLSLLQHQRALLTECHLKSCLSCSRLCAEHYTCLSASKRGLVSENS